MKFSAMLKNLRSLLYCFGSIILFYGCNKSNIQMAPKYECPINRFVTEQFTPASVTVQYGTATDYQGKVQNLQVDLNLPSSDTLALRPLIIYCHGGGFTGGARNNAWPVKFCQSFAKRGYVTASIDYRLGVTIAGNDNETLKAQIRAVQDLKAAVRFFKQTAVEQGNPYRIDTAQIYIGGESTGALIALQAAYMNNVSEFADFADVGLLNSVGGIEGSTNTSGGYSSRVTGVIGLSGAIPDLNWLTANDIPYIGVHGLKDANISYGAGKATPYISTTFYGSRLIDSAATALKTSSSLLVFSGAGSTPYTSSTKYADSTIKFVAQSLFELIDCQRLGVK
jgi:poly(3-hydroxybutyrate) depolymerase